MDASEASNAQEELRKYANTLKSYRGPYLGDGIHQGINGYKLADFLTEVAALLDGGGARPRPLTQEMVYAGIKEAVKQGIVPAVAHGEDDYLRIHNQIQGVLKAGLAAG